MPILDVEIVLKPGEALGRGLAQELADQVGLVFGTPPGRTWVKVRPLSTEHYAENSGGPHPGVYPVFVSVLKASLPRPDRLAVEVAELTRAVAEICDRPAENVHVLCQPPAAGRVSFGGKLAPGVPGPKS